MTDTKTSALASITPDNIAPATDLVAMVDVSGSVTLKTPVIGLRGRTKDVTGLSPYTVTSADAGALLVSYDSGSTPYSFIFGPCTDVDQHVRFTVDILAPAAGANFTVGAGATFYNGAQFHSVGAGSAGIAQVAHFDLLFQSQWQASNVAYNLLATSSGSSGSGSTGSSSAGYTYASSSIPGATGAIFAEEGTITNDVSGVTIAPVAYGSGSSPDYSTWTYVVADATKDITAWKATAYLALDEEFNSFSRFDRVAGTGFWDIGSTTQINNETEFYPLQAQIKTVGDDPFSLSNNILTISLKAINSAYVPNHQSSSQLWQSGRADSSMQAGFYAESGMIYLECVMKTSADPAAWPAFWAIASDNDYPIEHDVVEVFGNSLFYDATTHYQNASGSGNYSEETRTWMAAGSDLSTSFHKFGTLINYATGEIRNYFDDHYVGSVVPATCGPGFSKDIFVIFNMATGGLVPSPTSSTVLPLQTEFRQMRVFYGPATGGYGLVSASASYSGVQPETTAYVAACATPPSAAWQQAFNTMILAAKNLGFLDAGKKPLHWWMFATETQQAALIDILNPTAAPLVLNGSLVWTADRGFKGPATGSGSSGYLETGITLASQDQTNFMMQSWVTDIASTSYSGGIIGTSLGFNSNSSLRLETVNGSLQFVANLGNLYTYNFPSQENNPKFPNADKVTGFFALSKLTETVNGQKAVVTSEYVMGDAGFYMGQNYTAANQQTLPTATLRLIQGDDGAAMALVGPPWHSPRLKVWRDQVLRPFFTSIGLSV